MEFALQKKLPAKVFTAGIYLNQEENIMNTNRITEVAQALRNMAAAPHALDTKKLLSIADELDDVAAHQPAEVQFFRSVLSQYSTKN